MECGTCENPVGELQEMCIRNNWSPPSYNLEHIQGMPHDRNFTISCAVLSYCEVGSGKSKKEAKRIAAHKMCQLLMHNGTYGNNLSEMIPEENKAAIPAEFLERRYSELKSCKLNTLSNDKRRQKLVQFERNLRTSDSKKLYELRKTPLTEFDCIAFLQDLARELEFDITFIEVDEKLIDGRHQCLLQIAMFPLVICFGTGRTPKEAKMSAAFNALEYMKITISKF